MSPKMDCFSGSSKPWGILGRLSKSNKLGVDFPPFPTGDLDFLDGGSMALLLLTAFLFFGEDKEEDRFDLAAFFPFLEVTSSPSWKMMTPLPLLTPF